MALYESGGGVKVILTRRSVALPTHPGEIALPGGRVQRGENVVEAALREAREEVGIDPAGVEVVGWLDRVTGRTSGSVATPVVGLLPGPPELVPDPAEVEAVLTAGLAELAEVYRQELWDVPGFAQQGRDGGSQIPMHFFELGPAAGGHVVWGMTARVLHQLLVVLTERTGRRESEREAAQEGTTPPAPV